MRKRAPVEIGLIAAAVEATAVVAVAAAEPEPSLSPDPEPGSFAAQKKALEDPDLAQTQSSKGLKPWRDDLAVGLGQKVIEKLRSLD